MLPFADFILALILSVLLFAVICGILLMVYRYYRISNYRKCDISEVLDEGTTPQSPAGRRFSISVGRPSNSVENEEIDKTYPSFVENNTVY